MTLRSGPFTGAYAGDARCAYAWCATPHGRTHHPDDEAHRSSGHAFAARIRDDGSMSEPADATVEVGILRRLGDTESWVVLEVGGRFSLALSLEEARRLRSALVNDPDVGAAIDGCA